MPKIRAGMPRPPKGFEKISPKLDEFEEKMQNALSESTEGKRKVQLTWGVSQINTARTRYVYEVFRLGEIDQKVVDFCIAVQFIDGALIKLWSVQGYETVCCINCVDNRQSTFGGTCICRVPVKERISGSAGPCLRCGCDGCSIVDVAAARKKKQKEEDEA